MSTRRKPRGTAQSKYLHKELSVGTRGGARWPRGAIGPMLDRLLHMVMS